jgi:hypothetical protein
LVFQAFDVRLPWVDATLGHFHIDAGTAGVNGVLQKFLDHAGWSLHDLACSDLVDQGGGQLLNPGHEVVSRMGKGNAHKQCTSTQLILPFQQARSQRGSWHWLAFRFLRQ